jgi:hypothetical protein
MEQSTGSLGKTKLAGRPTLLLSSEGKVEGIFTLRFPTARRRSDRGEPDIPIDHQDRRQARKKDA